MNDAERLDAIGKYGLCLATHETLNHGDWEKLWVCHYWVGGFEKLVAGPDIRICIDSAVADIESIVSDLH